MSDQGDSMSNEVLRRRQAEITALVFAMAFPSVLTWVYFVALAGQPAGLQQGTYSIGKTIQFGFPLAWALAFERWRPVRPKKLSAGLLFGLAFGVLIAGTTLALFHGWLKPAGLFAGPGDAVREKVASVGITTASQFVGLSVFYAVCHSLLEEYYWRWFVFARLSRLMPLAAAILISSMGFMAHHVILLGMYFGYGSMLTWFFSISVAVGGAVWAWLYQRSGSLLGPWLSHCLVDAAIFLIGFELVQELWTGK